MDQQMLDAVTEIVRRTLGLDAGRHLDAVTPLLGMPELDSFAVVELAMALETHFGIAIDSEDFSADLFETVGTISAYIAARMTPSAAAE